MSAVSLTGAAVLLLVGLGGALAANVPVLAGPLAKPTCLPDPTTKYTITTVNDPTGLGAFAIYVAANYDPAQGPGFYSGGLPLTGEQCGYYGEVLAGYSGGANILGFFSEFNLNTGFWGAYPPYDNKTNTPVGGQYLAQQWAFQFATPPIFVLDTQGNLTFLHVETDMIDMLVLPKTPGIDGASWEFLKASDRIVAEIVRENGTDSKFGVTPYNTVPNYTYTAWVEPIPNVTVTYPALPTTVYQGESDGTSSADCKVHITGYLFAQVTMQTSTGESATYPGKGLVYANWSSGPPLTQYPGIVIGKSLPTFTVLSNSTTQDSTGAVSTVSGVVQINGYGSPTITAFYTVGQAGGLGTNMTCTVAYPSPPPAPMEMPPPPLMDPPAPGATPETATDAPPTTALTSASPPPTPSKSGSARAKLAGVAACVIALAAMLW